MTAHRARAAQVVLLALVAALASSLLGVGVAGPGPATAGEPPAVALGPPASTSRPNVLLILVDDMREDQLVHMPHVQELIADQGTTFDNAFSTFPLCCPARTSILTGQYAHNHRVMGNDAEQHGGYYWFTRHSDPQDTIGTWMRKRGYRTSLVGKFLNRYGDGDPREVPPGWDTWSVPPGQQAYDYTDQVWNVDGTLRRVPGHSTQATEKFTARAIDTAKPFFVWSGYLAPHDAWSPERGWHQPEPMRADRRALDVPPTPHEPDMSDKPRFLRQRLPVLQPGRRATIRRHSLLMAQAVRGVDRMIARTIGRLEASGELDDTLIIFASDNGFALGEHNIPSGKDLPYEEVTGVPLIMRGPGVPIGAHEDTLVTLHDITATITDLAGARAGRRQDGVSLLDVVADPAAYADRAVLYESGGIMGSTRELGRTSPDRRFFLGLRTRDHSYIQYVNGASELYDLRADPRQLDSLRDPALAKAMRSGLDRLKNCRGAACNRPIRVD
ncbi:MAG: sulfatase [Nocardioides sp.]|nr:sulfatase [Nocardioides sp.]